RLEAERGRLRQAIVAAASDLTTPSSARSRIPAALTAAIVLIVVGIVAVGARIWWQGAATLQAAIRFEVRLAEDQPGPGLREARIAGSDRVLYVHQEIVISNEDIAQSRVIQGDRPASYHIAMEFNATGAQKMRQATVSHIGRPVAILIDGDVVMAPVLRAPISTSAVISGDYTQAEAERIVNGIGIR
ncbi:MAG: hypothetical protein DMF98_06525, partial [Acidobacteria bacterium]